MAFPYCHGCSPLKGQKGYFMYNREMIINMESVKKVEEWIEIQKPENECEEFELKIIKESTEFVKTHVLKNGLFEIPITDAVMNIRACQSFKGIYVVLTFKSSITIKELI